MASLFTNLVQKVVISRKWTENGPMLDRERTDEVAEKSARMSAVWAMMRGKCVNCAKSVMQFLKWTKWTEQIFAESAESAKSAKSIFATFATFASANFVGKASCESTVRYREWSRIPSCFIRYSLDSHMSRFSLASLICLCMLTVGVGNAWGATHTSNFTTSLTYSDGSVTASSATWSASGTVGTGSPSIVLENVNGNGCLKIGAGKSNYYSSITLSTNYFNSYSVSSVVINMSANAASTKTITVTQGATTIGTATDESFSANNAWKNVTLNTNSGTSGTLTISISSGAQNTCINSITVTYTAVVPVTGVSVDPTSKAIVPGQTFTITPTVSPSNATNKNISWGSNATSYAMVSSGTVTGVAAGSATITATSAADGTKSASCSVTVYGVTISMVGEDESTVLTGAGIPSAPTRSGASIDADNTSSLYGFKRWVISNAELTNSYNSSTHSSTTKGNTITNPTGSVTLKAVYNAPRTVTWIVNGEEYTPYTTTGEGTDGTSAVQHGKAWSTLTLPTDPDPEDYCGKKFMGWTTTNIGSVGYDKTDDADAISSLVLMTSANKSSMTGAGKYINSNITFYAVFADYAE